MKRSVCTVIRLRGIQHTFGVVVFLYVEGGVGIPTAAEVPLPHTASPPSHGDRCGMSHPKVFAPISFIFRSQIHSGSSTEINLDE